MTQACVPHRISAEHNVATKGTMAVMGHRSPRALRQFTSRRCKALIEKQAIEKAPGRERWQSLVASNFRSGGGGPLWVKSGKARSEHIPSGLLPTADIVDAFWHFRFVPSADHLPVP